MHVMDTEMDSDNSQENKRMTTMQLFYESPTSPNMTNCFVKYSSVPNCKGRLNSIF